MVRMKSLNFWEEDDVDVRFPYRDDAVCCGCVEDAFLQDWIKSRGKGNICSFCESADTSILLDELSDLVANILRESYEEGPRYSLRDADGGISGESQQGAELYYLVNKVLQGTEYSRTVVSSVHDDLLSRGSCKGESAIIVFTESAKYIPKEVQCQEVESQWYEFKKVLMHRRRFFNDSGKDFLKWLFEDANELKGLGWEDKKVVRILPRGTTFFRARMYDNPSTLNAIIQEPLKQLGAPPPEKAMSGRMNPSGVPVFYGAFERETCIAELRPAVGGDVISGQFKLGRDIRILDFACMQSAYNDKKFSYFDPDYVMKTKRRQFITTLHEKISAPILPSQEHEYLATQVIAEYLSTVHVPKVDGVIFSSAQVEEGLNVVLFSHVVFDEESGENRVVSEWTDIPPVEDVPNISFVRRTLLTHKILGVKFSVEDSDPLNSNRQEPTGSNQGWADE